jgi:hypothetical protein
VPDLHQAVDLGAALHAGLAHRGAIHRSQALNLHIVFNHRDARLNDLVMRSVGAFGKAEAVAAYHCTVLQNHAVAYAAKLADHGMGMKRHVVADHAPA